MKTRIFSIFWTTLFVGLIHFNCLHAQINPQNPEEGRCSGIEEEAAAQTETETETTTDGKVTEYKPSRKRIELELFCEEFDDDKIACQRQNSKCEWHPKPKICDAKVQRAVINEEDVKFCREILQEEQCNTESQRCNWGYQREACHPKDPQNDADVKFCEDFDTNENLCERNSNRCDWG